MIVFLMTSKDYLKTRCMKYKYNASRTISLINSETRIASCVIYEPARMFPGLVCIAILSTVSYRAAIRLNFLVLSYCRKKLFYFVSRLKYPH